MTKKLFMITRNSKGLVLVTREIIAETEYHWTCENPNEMPAYRVSTVKKPNSIGFCPTIEQAIDYYIARSETQISYCKKCEEDCIANATEMHDRREEFIKLANDS